MNKMFAVNLLFVRNARTVVGERPGHCSVDTSSSTSQKEPDSNVRFLESQATQRLACPSVAVS